LQPVVIPQIRRHVVMLWRAVHLLRTQSHALNVCVADHTERLGVIEGAIMARSARHQMEADELARMQADLATRVEVGARVMSGDIRSLGDDT